MSLTNLYQPPFRMKNILALLAFTAFTYAAQGQTDPAGPEIEGKTSPFAGQEISINAFRNPSIGVEYRYSRFSVHAGYYPTILRDKSRTESGAENNTTSFVRAGLSYWFLPLYSRSSKLPSAFYTSLSYVRGLDYEYKGNNGIMGEAGFRWMVWKGLQLRLGVATLKASGRVWQVNPTPGVSYSFALK